jgi:hypothetical protein
MGDFRSTAPSWHGCSRSRDLIRSAIDHPPAAFRSGALRISERGGARSGRPPAGRRAPGLGRAITRQVRTRVSRLRPRARDEAQNPHLDHAARCPDGRTWIAARFNRVVLALGVAYLASAIAAAIVDPR